MKRILIAALVVLSANGAWAEDAPPEIPLTGSAAGDPVITVMNQAGRAAWQMEQDQNISLKARVYADQLAAFRAQVAENAKKLAQLDKQLKQVENDLLANYKNKKAGQSDEAQERLKTLYEERKKELANARKLANALPGQVKTLNTHIEQQRKVLDGIKSQADWVDDQGRGKGRALFHKHRAKMNEILKQIATNAEQIKGVIEKGSELDFKGEKTGKFEVTIAAVQDSKPEWEWTINGKSWKKGDKLYVGDDRTIKIQVKLVEDRRKQSRTIKGSAITTVKVTKKEYDFEYGNDNASSHWTVKEETYSDWRVDAKTPREPITNVSDSGVFGTVKGDVMTIELSPETVTESLHISVIGRVEWQMEGRRGGGPVLDSADASGNWSIDLNIAPAK